MKSLDGREVLVDTEDSMKALEAKNTALSQEVEALKRQRDDSSQEGRSHRLLSPTPAPSSSFHASDEMKTANVRNIFLKIKKKYENLLSISRNIHSVTNNMDLAAFGEFGKQIKDLRKLMQNEQNEDGGGGSQRSEG